MPKLSAAAASSFADEDSSRHDQANDHGRRLSMIARDDDTELSNPDVSPKKRKERLPPGARPWGFVRHLNDGETLAAEASKNVKPAQYDATLWWHEERYRFLIAVEKLVIDDLSPLQFVQFVRELRHVTGRVLFKYERRHDGSTGGAYRVWS
jgi:hypothetical protein